MSRAAPPPSRIRAGRPRGAWPVLALVSVLSILAACRSTAASRAKPVSEAACSAFAEALRVLREPDAERSVLRERARAKLLEALAAEPGWIPPRRVLDDLSSEELVGIEALNAHLAALAAHGDDPGELYLAGRLEGADGAWRFDRALSLDPYFAWGHHGRAWAASRAGRDREAVQHARRALELAQSSWESAFFSASLARFLDASGRTKDAVRELERRLEGDDLTEDERVSLRYELVRLDLKQFASPRAARAHAAGLDLLRTASLGETEIRALCTDLRIAGSFYDPRSLEIDLALASQHSLVRDRIRAEILMESAPSPLAEGLLEASYSREGIPPPVGRAVRVARFAAGDFTRAIEAWLAELPRAVCDADGLPRDAKLRRVVECGRALAIASPHSGSDTAARLDALARALIEAGWFREARSVADVLAKQDLARALEAHERAVAGMALIDDWSRIARGSDAILGRKVATPPKTDASADVSSMLTALAASAARAHRWLGGETDPAVLAESYARSPRIDYGPVGELVHPGPVFSAQDVERGFGPIGAPVPGLAAELDRLGRFGLLGQVLGDREPDATILPKLWVDFAEGEHLGVPWSGTVVWCESPDLDARVARRGAEIAAAALHEGYWIDVDAVRREHRAWIALRRGFSGDGGAARVERALSVSGIRERAPDASESAVSHARARMGSMLGEAERVRLAVLRDRGRAATLAADGAGATTLGEIDLDEIVAVTATHEQGHLCDRTRFFPIGEHLPVLFLFLLDSGFSPQRVAERLESRAQLVSLCDSADPRIPLAQVLDAAEEVREGVTPHTRAYSELAREFVAELSADLLRNPAAYPELDPEATLVHQLHRLPPQTIRHVARLLAHKKRMLREAPLGLGVDTRVE